MKYMLLIYNSPDEPQDEAVMGEYFAFTQRIVESGEFVAGDPLHGTDSASLVRVRDGKTAVTDGPYADTKEQLGGYYIVDAPDLDRATAIAAQIPGARYGAIEVRPIIDMSGAPG